MINLIDNKQVPETQYFVIRGGTFEDTDLVVCVDVNGNEAAFQAFYIFNGACVGE